MKALYDILENHCDAQLCERVKNLIRQYDPSWHADLQRIFIAAFYGRKGQPSFFDVMLELERHWTSYLCTRPESERVRPTMTDLLHPTHNMIRDLRRKFGL